MSLEFAHRQRSREQRWRVLLPKGDATIAQCFSIGMRHGIDPSPEGTADMRPDFQPSLRDFLAIRLAHPTLKRWAIVEHPYGMKTKSW